MIFKYVKNIINSSNYFSVIWIARIAQKYNNSSNDEEWLKCEY